jgi:hypothetical protein
MAQAHAANRGVSRSGKTPPRGDIPAGALILRETRQILVFFGVTMWTSRGYASVR